MNQAIVSRIEDTTCVRIVRSMESKKCVIFATSFLCLLFHYVHFVSGENNAWMYRTQNSSLLSQTTKLHRLHTVTKVKSGDDPTTFFGRPKTREERWHNNFFSKNSDDHDQTLSLVNLLNKIVQNYLNACVPIILYDMYVQISDTVLMQSFLQTINVPYLHGKINANYTVVNQDLLQPVGKRCTGYILFLEDVLRSREVLGPQTTNRVIIIPRSTQWKVQEFLLSKVSSDLINLLVISQSISADPDKEHPYVLYTHRLYTDGLGSNAPLVLTSWIKGKLSRPHVNLFPKKFSKGFAGHRFTVTAIYQPPFVLKRTTTDGAGNINIEWDGIEVRLLKLLSQRLNFTYDIFEPKGGNELGPTYGVINLLENKRADIGICGAFITNERLARVEMSTQHSKDCAAFLTLASKALPRYRAIMGPFQWPVWAAIIAAYMFAMFPLAYSDRLTLRHLIGNWGEIENMFWYVFGTFTNSLTFTGEYSWSNTRKTSTRILIGTYWVFSIIITACYTSSIIAFVTLPVFPDTVDTVNDLLNGYYRVGTFAKDGWQHWFTNSSHKETKKLFKNLELVANVEEGLRNVTNAFFWGYAFMGPRAQLEYIVQKNFTFEGTYKRSALHIGHECISIFGISYMYPKNSVYTVRLNDALMEMAASGMIKRIYEELAWDTQRRSSSQLLQASKAKKFNFAEIEERKLNLADTEGMFLLMAFGYLVAAGVLTSEIVGGCSKKFRNACRRTSKALSSARSSLHQNSSRRSSYESQTETAIPQNHRGSIFDRFRRHSDSNKVPVRHKRVNSLIEGLNFHQNYCKENDDHTQNEVGVKTVPVTRKGDNLRLNVHCAEINRPPTPYVNDTIEEIKE